VLGEDTKPHTNGVGERNNDFETSQSDAFAASGFRLASDIFVLTVESGLNDTVECRTVTASGQRIGGKGVAIYYGFGRAYR